MKRYVLNKLDRVKTDSMLRAVTRNTNRQHKWRRLVAFLCVFVAIMTMNGLRLDAVTLEHVPMCGMEEHSHTEACVDEGGQPICDLPEHQHTDACFQERPQASESEALDDFIEVNGEVELAALLEAVPDGEGSIEAPVEEVEIDLGGDEPLVDSDEPLTCRMDGETAFLSDVLSAVGLSAHGVTAVGERVDGGFANTHISVEPVEGVQDEYIIRAVRDFEIIELGIVSDEGTASVWLLNGIAAEPVEVIAGDETAIEAEVFSVENAVLTEVESNIIEIDLTEAADYPLSLRALMAGFEGAEILSVEYDEALLSVEDVDGDRLITPMASFDRTELCVDGEYLIALLNGVSPWPAQTFEGATDYVTVRVEADEGAFPAGTTMALNDIEDEATLNGIGDAVTEQFVEVQRVHAVDITFHDTEGREIEPRIPISVVMSVREIEQDEEASMVHLDDAGHAQVVADAVLETETDAEELEGEAMERMVFVADSFSVYAVVVTKKLETRFITAGGDTYNITVTYGQDASVPEGAALVVREIGGDEALMYLDRAEQTLDATRQIALARFFDIKIMDGESEVRPAAPVMVSAELVNDVEMGEEPPVPCAIHFDRDVAEVVQASEKDETVTFRAEGFSVWGVVYTVDFHYTVNGMTYDYGMPGGDCASLRELLPALGIAEDLMDAIAGVEFSNPDVVRVAAVTEDTTVGALRGALGIESRYSDALTADDRAAIDGRALLAGDWALFSLAPFDTMETLTVAMSNGDSFAIAVTDAQITTRAITADGSAYNITLTFGPEADIPLDAALRVAEIEPGSAAWYEYAAQAAAVVDGGALGSDSRFFDIEIWAGDEKVEPKAPVSVSIALEGVQQADAGFRVVHFGEGGPVEVALENQTSVTGDYLPVVTTDIRFNADAFSVYGAIVVPAGASTGVNDLDGRTFVLNYGSYYMSSTIRTDTSPHQLDAADRANASVWQFESAGVDGYYYISTIVHSTVDGNETAEKVYLYMDRQSDNWAHGTLKSEPQAFKVEKSGNNYVFSALYDQRGTPVTYYLRERKIDGHEGFSGSVWNNITEVNMALEFTEGTITDNEQYMLLTKYEGQWYIIHNDGTLIRVDDPSVAAGRFEVDDPMVWQYGGSDQAGHVLYHPTKETGFTGENLAYDYFYRYLDPDVGQGYTDENADNTVTAYEGSHTQYKVVDRPLMRQIRVDYVGHKLKSHGNTFNYVGIVQGEDGRLSIAGQQSEANAAEIYFVKMLNESDIMVYTNQEKYHTVNHIDISIVGNAAISAPLAYGTYYYKDGNGVVQTLIVTRENQVTVDLTTQVDVTEQDIKRANVVAYTKADDGTHNIIDNAFYISGYSGNNESQVGSTNQTRIEGVFKVADLPPLQNGWNVPAYTDNNDKTHAAIYGESAVKTARLNNRIYYTVSTTKKITFDLKYNGFKLYETEAQALAEADTGVLRGTSMVTLSNTFDYWDLRNECPPIYLWQGELANWKSGRIVYGSTPKDGSGMDFALGTVDKDKYGILAIEITKYIVDKAGNIIEPMENVHNKFTVYRKASSADPYWALQSDIDAVAGLNVGAYANGTANYSGYTALHGKETVVGEGGTGSVYDYDVEAGMIYIEEDRSDKSLPKTLEDVNGKVWQFVGTRLETEYVWRGNGVEYTRHVSKTYTPDDAHFNSDPDVLGNYKDVTGIDCYNGFLEFFVYNIYDEKPIDVSVKKVWKYQNGSLAPAPAGASIDVELGRYRLVEDADNPVTGKLQLTHQVNSVSVGSYSANYKIKKGNKVLRSFTYDAENPTRTIDHLPKGTYTLQITENAVGVSADTRINNVSATTSEIEIEVDHTTTVDVVTTLTTLANTRPTVAVWVRNRLDNGYIVDNSNSKQGWYSENVYQDNKYVFPASIDPGDSKIVITINRPGEKHTEFKAKYRVCPISVRSDGTYGENDINYGSARYVGAEDTISNGTQADHFPSAPQGSEYSNVDQDFVFELPQSGGVLIEFCHDWGNYDFYINAVTQMGSAPVSSQTTTPPPTATTPPPTATPTPSPSFKPATAAPTNAQGEVYTPTGNDPEAKVPGMKYIDDVDEVDGQGNIAHQGFSQRVRLANGVWQNVFRNLPATDANGFRYLYYIRSITEYGVPEGTLVSIDSDSDGNILTCAASDTLPVTNKIPNKPPKVTLRKVDENGQPLKGAKFQVTKTDMPGYSEITTGNDGICVVEWFEGAGLPDGDYTINEVAAPAGCKTLSGNITFSIVDHAVILGTAPAEVAFDGDSYTYTIVNEPRVQPGNLKIVKRWQDIYGNVLDIDENTTANLTLLQMVKYEGATHNLKVEFYQNDQWRYTADNWSGRGAATIRWNWNKFTHNPASVRVTINGVETNAYTLTYQDFVPTNEDHLDVVPNGYRTRAFLTLWDDGVNNSNQVTVRVDVDNSNYTAFDEDKPDFQIQWHIINRPGEGYTLTGGSKTIALPVTSGEDREWFAEFSVAGDGLLASNSATLPATYNSMPCRYVIVEEDLPEGFAVNYSDNNILGVDTQSIGNDGTAVLTAYNRLIQTDVKLVKVDKEDHSITLPGAKFAIYRIDPKQTGVVYMTWNGANNPYTTNENGEVTFQSLPVGCYEIVETQAPTDYLLPDNSDYYFYIKVAQEGVYFIEKDLEKRPEKWRVHPNDNMLATNEPGTLMVGNEWSKGSLKIKKIVTVNGQTPAQSDTFYVDGAYDFSITGPLPVAQDAAPIQYVRVIIKNGVMDNFDVQPDRANLCKDYWDGYYGELDRWAYVRGLEPGDYEIKELGGYECAYPEGGGFDVDLQKPLERVTLTALTGGKAAGEGYDGPSVANGTVTVTVTQGDTAAMRETAQATYTNDRSFGSLKLKKTVLYHGATPAANEYSYVRGLYDFKIEGPVTKYVRISVNEGGIVGNSDIQDVWQDLGTRWENYPLGDYPDESTDRWVHIDNLPVGDYVITELGAYKWNGNLTNISEPLTKLSLYGIDGGKLDGNSQNDATLDSRAVTVTVTAGETNPVTDATSAGWADFKNSYWSGMLGIRKDAVAHTNHPVNGDNTLLEGTYRFNVKGPLDANDTPVDGAIDKDVRIYARNVEGSVKYAYEVLDHDATLTAEQETARWDSANAVSMNTNGFVHLPGLRTGDYIITEGEWTPDHPGQINGASMIFKGFRLTQDSNDTAISDPLYSYISYDMDDRTVRLHIDGTDFREIYAVFNNELDPDTLTMRKMVLDTNDTTGAPGWRSNSEFTWSDTADYDIGDDVPYRITAFLPQKVYQRQTAYDFRIEDKMQNLQFTPGQNHWHMYAFVKGPTDEVGAWYQVDRYFEVTVGSENAASATIEHTIPTTGHANTVHYYLQAKVRMDGTTNQKGLKGITEGYRVPSNWSTHSNALQPEPVFGNDAVMETINPEHIQYIQFRYDAELMGTAVLGGKPGKNGDQFVQANIDYGNANDAMIRYTEPSAPGGIGSTGWDRNRVYTYSLTVNKRDENSDPLSGATFALFKKYHAYKLSSTDIAGGDGWQKHTYTVDNVSRVLYGPAGVFPAGTAQNMSGLNAGHQAEADAYIYVRHTGDGASFTWNGIDDGEYLLVEAAPPFGYRALTTPISLTINADHEFEADDPWWNSGKVTVSPHDGASNVVGYFEGSTAHVSGQFVFTSGITANIPNTPYIAGINVVKIDETTRGQGNVPLTGAKFRLLMWDGIVPPNGDTVNYTATFNAAYGDEAGVAIGQDGALSFAGLRDGEYRIEETRLPAGYIKTEDNDIYFRLEQGIVYRHTAPTVTTSTATDPDTQQETTTRSIEWGTPIDPAAQGDDHAVACVTYTRATEIPTSDAVFTVGNTPGAKLPSTGGMGTTIFYLVGSILTLAASMLLITRHRDPGRGE